MFIIHNSFFKIDQRCSFTTLEQNVDKEYLNEEIVFICYCPGCTAFSYLLVGCLFIILVVGLVVIYRKSTMPRDSSDFCDTNTFDVIHETRL